MREGDAALNAHTATLARPPHCAGEIAQSIGRKQRRSIERRYEECAGQVRPMVLHTMEAGPNTLGIDFQALREGRRDVCKRSPSTAAVQREVRHAQGVEQLRSHPGPWAAWDCQVIHLVEGDPGG